MSASGDIVQITTEADVNDEQKQKKVKENDEPTTITKIESNSTTSAPIPATITRVPTEEDDAEADSEAETWIQSPEKKRSVMAETAVGLQVKTADSDAGSTIIANTSDKENSIRKRKRVKDGTNLKRSPSILSSRRSSPLSSPAPHGSSDGASGDGLSARKMSSTTGYSETEVVRSSPKRRSRRPSEIVPPSPTQRRSKRGSMDADRRETRSATFPRPSDDEKSVSPEPRIRHEHRRGFSTQLTSGEMGEKKKRGRPPNVNTTRHRSMDRASEDSADSSSRRPRPSVASLAKLTSQDGDLMSPARPASRKLRDKIGRTPLARACHNGDVELVRIRFAERPQDLRVQDNAENTPLQIACLEGHDEVVEFLISQGAEINIQNNVKDTPLIDAVENGHVDVVRLLLKHGANPRLANQNGDEPVDLITEDTENGPDIKELLEEAREQAKKALGIDINDVGTRDGASSRAASAASPRDSPPVSGRSPSMFNSRRRTGRSEPTRNDLLYEAKTPENLVRLAGKGDVQGVVEIVQVLPKAPTEALIAAARGGHQQALEMLIGLGKPDPDPDPIRGTKMASGHNTPILAAIGRGHPKIVRLLAEQSGFNPMKRLGGRTYFEIAEERKGERWEEEVKYLKEAYSNYKNKKSQSPRKSRDVKPKVRPRRRSSSTGSTRLSNSSPEASRSQQVLVKSKEMLNGEKRKVSDPTTGREKPHKKEDSGNGSASEAEQTTSAVRTTRPRRSQSDLPPMSSSTEEPAQKRRRLVSGKEHRNRQTVKTLSDDEDMDVIEDLPPDRSQQVLKRTRSDSNSDHQEGGQERATIKKRRTVVESSPAQPTMLELPMTRPEVSPTVKQEPSQPEQIPVPATDAGTLPDAEVEQPTVETVDAGGSEDDYSPPPADEPTIDNDEALKAEQARQEADRVKAEKDAAAEQARRKEAEELERRQAEEARLQLLKQQEKDRAEAEQKRQAEERARQQREEEERNRLAAEKAKAEQEERQHEQERDRIDSLPLLLAKTAELIDQQDPEAKNEKFLRKKYLPLYSIKTEQLHGSTDDAAVHDKWVPSFQVAGLLSTKDLGLSQYPALGKVPATDWEIRCMWRWARLQLSYDLDFSCFKNSSPNSKVVENTAEQKFFAMAGREKERPFWVKVCFPSQLST